MATWRLDADAKDLAMFATTVTLLALAWVAGRTFEVLHGPVRFTVLPILVLIAGVSLHHVIMALAVSHRRTEIMVRIAMVMMLIGWAALMTGQFANVAFFDQARAFVGMSLVAHLGDNSVLLGFQPKLSGFPDGMGERFFDQDMLAHSDGHQGRCKVHMVRCGYGYGVNLRTHLFEHDPEVPVAFGVRIRFVGFRGSFVIHIAECDYFLILDALHRSSSSTASADTGNAEFLGVFVQDGRGAGPGFVLRLKHFR